ncbi:hypothetical protein ADL19_06720 [Streptomyces purpurogeneiscleroticus]|nr:hypothetical protein ADL19_06720 [Streptomyces purpurogeneiscleroticus]
MPLSQVQIIRSLGEALAWFERELVWGVPPAELRHLTGRIQESRDDHDLVAIIDGLVYHTQNASVALGHGSENSSPARMIGIRLRRLRTHHRPLDPYRVQFTDPHPAEDVIAPRDTHSTPLSGRP